MDSSGPQSPYSTEAADEFTKYTSTPKSQRVGKPTLGGKGSPLSRQLSPQTPLSSFTRNDPFSTPPRSTRGTKSFTVTLSRGTRLEYKSPRQIGSTPKHRASNAALDEWLSRQNIERDALSQWQTVRQVENHEQAQEQEQQQVSKPKESNNTAKKEKTVPDYHIKTRNSTNNSSSNSSISSAKTNSSRKVVGKGEMR